jgi:hypothetical protein
MDGPVSTPSILWVETVVPRAERAFHAPSKTLKPWIQAGRGGVPGSRPGVPTANSVVAPCLRQSMLFRVDSTVLLRQSLSSSSYDKLLSLLTGTARIFLVFQDVSHHGGCSSSPYCCRVAAHGHALAAEDAHITHIRLPNILSPDGTICKLHSAHILLFRAPRPATIDLGHRCCDHPRSHMLLR